VSNLDQAPLVNLTEREPEKDPIQSQPLNAESPTLSPGKPVAAATPIPPASAAKPKPKPPPVNRSEPSPASGVLQQRLATTRTWLAESGDSRYTIQLMVVTDNSPARLEKFLRKIGNSIELGQIYIYPTHLSADNQFSITFGDFPSRASALVALAQLPVTYQANHPFLQTTKGIREEIAR
jgi:DamX protein